MASFLLVHGSWHGAWCWDHLVPRLAERGHQVEAIDLPGHGEDRTPAWRITADDYAHAIVSATKRFDSAPILVGHSMGGLAITHSTRHAPDAFSQLVYLCAFFPLGRLEMLRLSLGDRDSLVTSGMRPRLLEAAMRKDRAKAIFYGDCSDEDAAWASARLRPDPVRPVLGMLDRAAIPVPHTYIECTHDRAISIALQRTMHRRAGFERVETLDADHSPFLSAPDRLTNVLDRIAGG